MSFANPRAARAAEDPEIERLRVEKWLDSESNMGSRDEDEVDLAEAPPPPPGRRGLVLESAVGAMGHLGALKNVTPTMPWFHLQLGYEIFDFAMVLVEGDLSIGSTAFTNPPPEPRGFSLISAGGGVRFTVRPADRFGISLQGTIGAGTVTNDVLVVYGYRDSTDVNPYFGGQLGLEWYQVSSHFALAAHGGVRNYNELLGRQRSSETALAWLGNVTLRYTF